MSTDTQSLNPFEAKLMEEITQDNKLMRRKLDGSKPRRRSNNRKVPVRVYKPENVDESDMKKKVEELEKMQALYKQRINELENQITPPSTRSPNRRRNKSSLSDYQYFNTSPKIRNASPKVTHSSPKDTTSPQIGTASPKILHSSPQTLRSPKAAQYNTSPRTTSSPRRRRNPVGDSKGSYTSTTSDQSRSSNSSSRYRSDEDRPRILALYDYVPTPDTPGRLAFKEGDVLWLVNSKSRSGWWVAEYGGKSGKIPSNYVEQLDLTKSFKARVIQSFEAQQKGDLSIQRGSIITILKKQENGWFLGERGGVTGFFPSTNVEKIDSPLS